MKLKILIINFLFFATIIAAQPKIITGATIIDQDKEDFTPASNVSINNLRSFAKTITNSEGYFSIPVMVGDTLKFSADFLDTRKIVISESMYNKGVLQIHLDLETINLSEAIIGNINKDLAKNIKYKRDLRGDLYNSIGLDQRLRDLEPKKDISKFKPLDVLNPVRLIGHVNGYYKKERRTEEFLRQKAILDEVINYFPEDFFLKDLNIPDYKVVEFIAFADKKLNLKNRVRNRQFELIGLELEEVSKEYLLLLNTK